MATIKPLSVSAKRLAQTISGSAMAFKLDNILSWDGTTNLTSSDFGTKAYVAFRNSAGTLVEFMEIDPSTIASASITILRRGLKYNGDDLTTEVSANKLTWVKGDTIVELGTHLPQLLAHMVRIVGDQTVDGIKTFTSVPVTTGGNPVNANDLARKGYVDSVVAGIATTVNVVVPGTAGATLAAGSLVYLDDATDRWKLCDADTAATVENVMLGISQGAATDGNTVPNGILLRGLDSNQSGLTAGSIYYASNTAGAISSSVGTTEVTVGFAYSTTQLYFNPRFNQQLTEDQQDALAGSSGTPSNSNRYVTQADTTFSPPPGMIAPYGGSSAPTGWLLCDGSAVSRTTYATLFAIVGTTFGSGDGSTTFTLPDLRSRFLKGAGAGTKTVSFAAGDVNTGTDVITVPSNTDLYTGTAVVITNSGGSVPTGLTASNTYYVIRSSATAIKLASSLANAIAGTAIDLTAQGSGTNVLTITLTNHAAGTTGGEETHSLVVAEIPAHTHTYNNNPNGGGGGPAGGNISSDSDSGSTGGSTAHNNLPPFLSVNYIIKT